MEVGDTRKVGNKTVTVVATEPDANGEIIVRTDDGYYTICLLYTSDAADE